MLIYLEHHYYLNSDLLSAEQAAISSHVSSSRAEDTKSDQSLGPTSLSLLASSHKLLFLHFLAEISRAPCTPTTTNTEPKTCAQISSSSSIQEDSKGPALLKIKPTRFPGLKNNQTALWCVFPMQITASISLDTDSKDQKRLLSCGRISYKALYAHIPE